MVFGYTGKVLRVDLSERSLRTEQPDEAVYADWLGGTGLGVYYLINEVTPDVTWDHPENRVILASGPLGGTRVPGTGLMSVVTRGPMTGGACSTQANGYFGAFIKQCGYDGVILQGTASDWVYLYVDDNGAELRDATHLLGLDTWEIKEELIRETGMKQLSVFGIGPAGENRVRFSALVGDEGHVAAHNGIGAVLGAKRIKAVAVARGKQPVKVHDPDALTATVKTFREMHKSGLPLTIGTNGTGGNIGLYAKTGGLPVKNLSTNIFDDAHQIDGQYIRANFNTKPAPCWACSLRSHCQIVTVTEGPYEGYRGEEPELEAIAGLGSNLGILDAGAVVMLSNLVDRLGLDVNESSWALSWAFECYEAGLFTKEQTGGLELTWGNHEAAKELLLQIAHRKGFGALLSEGIKVAAEQVGGAAKDRAVYTEKGAPPRGHDHRVHWNEMLDTATSSTGTIEAIANAVDISCFNFEPVTNPFDWRQVATYLGKVNGHRHFIDCIGACRFVVDNMETMAQAVSAATGRELTPWEGLKIGKRITNALRLFNLRCGITREVERPSKRYGSAPVDGPASGVGVEEVWDKMVDHYYATMGWDPKTGEPLPETLKDLGLEAPDR